MDPDKGEEAIRLAATTVIVTALLAVPQALAHQARHKPHRGLKERIAFQVNAFKHHRYVCRHGRARVRQWHCEALLWTKRELAESRSLQRRRSFTSPVNAILFVFGPYGRQALAVSSCETGGTFSTQAQNGQYLGLFQMGNYARSVYGHGDTALSQAQAAYRYFVASGRDWSPWSCRP